MVVVRWSGRRPARSHPCHTPPVSSSPPPRPFFKDLVDYIVSGPVVAMVWQGDGVVLSARKLIGATNPLASEPGTIRGDFAVATGRNVVHGSDSPENGEREAALWFGGGSDRVAWNRAVEPWLVE